MNRAAKRFVCTYICFRSSTLPSLNFNKVSMVWNSLLSIQCWCCNYGFKVFDKLTKTMVGKRNELGDGYSWTLLHQMDTELDTYIHDKYSRMMSHSKLVVARRLMEECFEPIQDRHTRVKVIPSVIYNCGYEKKILLINHKFIFSFKDKRNY